MTILLLLLFILLIKLAFSLSSVIKQLRVLGKSLDSMSEAIRAQTEKQTETASRKPGVPMPSAAPPNATIHHPVPMPPPPQETSPPVPKAHEEQPLHDNTSIAPPAAPPPPELPQTHHGQTGILDSVQPPPAPSRPQRQPSAFESRLIALRNWFIYGNSAGKNSGESLEKMLATTWLLRTGILVILITSAFLLKLSIDRGLLAPSGRVAVSYLFGTALLVCGLHRKLRPRYWALGQALAGIGLGIFYFSGFALVSMYHLAPPLVGGLLMALTTFTAGFLADRLASLTIAMVSMLGGFATPLLLNTGAKNFPLLTFYLLLLGIGVLWLANRRNWQQLTWLAMLFTYTVYGLAYKTHFTVDDFAACQTALILFFILYSTSAFIHNMRLKVPATAMEIIGLLGNSGLFFWLSSLAVLAYSGNDRLALAPLTIGLACYYLAHSTLLMRRKAAEDRNLLLIFCALAGFYIALTFPVILSGEYLAPAWAMQAFLMLWLGYKLESRFLRGCAWALYATTLLRLSFFDFPFYGIPNTDVADESFWMGSLVRCLQFLIPVASMAWASKLTFANSPNILEARENNTETEPDEPPCLPRTNLAAAIFLTLAFALGFIFMRLEISCDLMRAAPSFHLTGINLVWMAAACLALLLLKRRLPGFWWPLFLILDAGIVLGIVIDFIQPNLWNCCHPDFLWSYSIGTIINTCILAFGLRYVGNHLPKGRLAERIALACAVLWPIVLFAHSTREFQTIITHKLPGLEGGGISVLWSIFAFFLVFNGLRKSQRALRYIGLGLFTIVVLKVFLLDMARLDAVFRVVAFLVFGILLMCAAFIYLKFWRGKGEQK